MDNSKIIFIGIAVLVVGIFLFVFFTMLSKSSKKIDSSTTTTAKKPNLSDLDVMLATLELDSTDADDISRMVERFLNTQKLESRSSNPSETLKKQFDFVTKVSTHQNTHAKTIARLNIKLKEAYPEYHKEIEMCEALGLMKRRQNG